MQYDDARIRRLSSDPSGSLTPPGSLWGLDGPPLLVGVDCSPALAASARSVRICEGPRDFDTAEGCQSVDDEITGRARKVGVRFVVAAPMCWQLPARVSESISRRQCREDHCALSKDLARVKAGRAQLLDCHARLWLCVRELPLYRGGTTILGEERWVDVDRVRLRQLGQYIGRDEEGEGRGEE